MALSERDRRTVTIGGVVLGVLLAGFVLFSVLGGGEEAFPPIPPTTPGAESPSPSPERRPSDPELHRAGPLLRPALPLALPVADGSRWRRERGRERERDSLSVERRRRHADAVPDGAGRWVESERRRVHGRVARHLRARRCDPRPGGGRRHGLRRGRRGAVRGRQVRAALGGRELRDVPLRGRAVHPLHQRAEIARRPAHGGSGRRSRGRRLRRPRTLRSARWGPIRCFRAQDAHRRGVSREGAGGHPRRDAGGRARGSQGDRG